MRIKINVFKLGRAYKALLDELRLGGNLFIMNPIDPESLIYRFAKQLEFGPSMMQVASEAVRIVQRMNRDWMVTGRRPAGICGAALILAARMNNFRRTVREVVYVVKVTELTIHHRLNEFKATESGDLTVDQFRSVQLENAHDPPSFSHSKDPKRLTHSKKRKAPETAAEIEGEGEGDDEDAVDSTSLSSSPPARKSRRVDADGFAIPDIPIDPALLAADSTDENTQPEATSSSDVLELSAGAKGKRGLPKGFTPTQSDIASESALEDEMTKLLAQGSNLMTPENPQAPNSGVQADKIDQQKRIRRPVSSSTEIASDEFDSDPEVGHCLLSPAEVEIKERIWVHENKDYLRTQQAKVLKRALAEEDAAGTKMPHKPRKRRKGRLGDVTYLQGGGGDGEGADGKNGSRASTPAEATRLMLERRGFSKKINYRLLEEMYEDDASSADKKEKEVKRKQSESENEARARSRSRSIRSASVASERSLASTADVGAGAGATGLSGRAPPRERVLKSSRASAVPAASASSTSTSTRLQSPSQQPTSHSAQAKEIAAPSAPNPNEEILGYIGPEPNEGQQRNKVKEGVEEDGMDEEEYEEEEEEEEEDYDDDDGVDAAFAGDYYDDGSDGGYEEY